MWIESTNPGHQGGKFKDAEMEASISFTENGKAQVEADIGERLIAEYDDFTESGDAAMETDEGDTTTVDLETGDADDDGDTEDTEQ